MRTALIAFVTASLLATRASPQVPTPPAEAPSLQPAAPQAASAPSAAPASGAPTAVSGVVVEAASKNALNAFASAADQFSHEASQPSPVHQLTRWTRPVCAEAFGLRKDLNAYIAQRIGAVAHEVGAADAGKCRGANVLVVFTIHPEAVMADVRDHHPILLGPHSLGADTVKVATFKPPMKSWYVTLTAASAYATANKGPPEARLVDSAYGQEQPNCTEIRECTLDKMRTMRSEFAFALVVVQSDAIVGKPIGAIADEIAMTVLNRPGPRTGCSALPSVMDLLDPACAANHPIKGLTAYDKAYLKALYAPHDTEILFYERGRIERAVQAVGLSPPAVPEEDPAAAEEGKAEGAGHEPAPPIPAAAPRPADPPAGSCPG